MRRFQWSAIANLIFSGCAGDETIGAVNLWNAGQGERDWTHAEYDTIWVRGGVTDTLLAGPSQVALTPDGGAVVLDVTTQQVHSFDGLGRLARISHTGERKGSEGRVEPVAGWSTTSKCGKQPATGVLVASGE